MALPKFKKSKAKSRSRRANYLRIDAPNLVPCPNCGAMKLPHRVCPECGYYKGKLVVSKKVKAKKEETAGK